MTLEASAYSLISESLCLNFVNTKNWNESEGPYEFFADYKHLLAWGLQLGLMTPAQAEAKRMLATQQPQQAQALVERVRLLRGALYRIFFALANQQPVDAVDLTHFNDAWHAALTHLRVTPLPPAFHWDWADADSALDAMIWPVLQDAAGLLISEKLGRVKSCGGCGWLFLDSTKAGHRRWCDMSRCGNRAKARRHYARGKEST